MTKSKKRAHLTAATVKRAMETGQLTGRSTTSTRDDTTAAGCRQTGIAPLLSHGAESAVTLRHLRTVTGLSGRDIRRMIESERRQGVAICADNLHGYFLAADDQERRRFVNSMMHRAMEIAKTAAAVEQAEVN